MGIVIITVVDDGGVVTGGAAVGPLISTTSSSSSQQPKQQPGQQQRCEHRCEIARIVHHVPRLRVCVNVLPGQDCRITVRADPSTFSWLMAWVKAQHTDGLDAALPPPPPPVLEPGNVVPLLLASSFLRMRPLARTCVEHAAAHLPAAPTHQLLALPAGLLSKVAAAASEEALEALQAHAASELSELQHPHGLLAELLFKHKLRVMMQQHGTTLERCQACGSVFSTAARTKLVCSCSTSTAGRQAGAGHTRDPTWDLSAFLQQQHPLRCWRELFWLVWSTITVLPCAACGAHFPARERDSCRFHPHAAVFTSEAAPGCHACCGAPAWRPGMPRSMRADGCRCRLHEPAGASAAGPPDSVLQLLARFSSLISRPWPHLQVDDEGADAAHVLPHQQQQQQQEGESEGLAAAVPLLMALVCRHPVDHAARHSCRVHGLAEASSTAGRSDSSSDDEQADGSLSSGDDASSDDDDDDASSDTCSSTTTTGGSDAADTSSNTCTCCPGLPAVCSRLGGLVTEVRTTAAARSRHTGLSASIAAAAASGDATVAAADAHTRMGVALPLAETFSAGGRRVLQAARRHQQQEASGGVQQQSGAAGKDSGGTAPIIMTRGRLLQLLLDEDHARTASLMQHLDGLRAQPLPSAGVDAARSKPTGCQAACTHPQHGARGGTGSSAARSGQAHTAQKKKKKKRGVRPV